jgi:exodeoxyribonuclease VII large subunit
VFAEEKKRPLPPHPRAIGIVTSPAAAALRDVVTTLRRRMPTIPVILYPTPVQGNGAAEQIAAAIKTAGARAEVDVLIVCRGGGSLEDLWAFNEEVVARAVAASPIPVVSGVGHETDFTICDFVADLRAPTPTGAAERVSPSRDHLLSQLEMVKRRLERALSRQLIDKGQRLDFLARRLTHPGERLQRQREKLQTEQRRLSWLMTSRLDNARRRLGQLEARLLRQQPRPQELARQLDRLGARLQQSVASRMAQDKLRLAQLEASLIAMNPEAVLTRGYAIVQKRNGHAVRSPEELRQGERITLRLAEGQTEALVDHPQGLQPELPF